MCIRSETYYWCYNINTHKICWEYSQLRSLVLIMCTGLPYLFLKAIHSCPAVSTWAMSNGRFHYYHMGKLFSAVYAVFYGTCRLVCNSVCFLVMISLLCLCVCVWQQTSYSSICLLSYLVYLTLWCRKMTLVNTQCDAEETEPNLKVSDKNIQSKRWSFKNKVFHKVHWALWFWHQMVNFITL